MPADGRRQPVRVPDHRHNPAQRRASRTRHVSAIERDYGSWLHLGNNVILGIFVLEALLKLAARWPRPQRYFTDGWNVFDFTVVVLALIPATGEFAIVTRLFRLLRVVRLISTIRDLRLIVAALVRSIPSVGHVLILMSIVVYIYAIMGYHLFHSHDPDNWRNLARRSSPSSTFSRWRAGPK